MMRMLLLPLGVLVLLSLTAALGAAELFVAVNGDDTASGTAQTPFGTIGRAQVAVRDLKASGLQEDVTVSLGPGTYEIDAPLVFAPSDGGDDRFAVTYRARPDSVAGPVISGGRRLSGWQPQPDGTWSVKLPEFRGTTLAVRQLFIDGRRATRARHPNAGYLNVASVGADRRTNFQFHAGDLSPLGQATYVRDIELVFLHDWSISRVPIATIDLTDQKLTVQHQVGGLGRWCLMDWFEKAPRYYLEDSATFLDAPGEWHADRDHGTLRYRPLPGESPDSIPAVAAALGGALLQIRGDEESGHPVTNLHFIGLQVRHAAWHPPQDVYWGRQACTYWSPSLPAGVSHREADPAAVQFDLATNCSFRNGRVEQVGASGIWLGRSCRDCRVTGSIVADVGGNGIMVGEGQTRKVDQLAWWETSPEQAAISNQVTNNTVTTCGQELFGAVGIWVGLAGQTMIAHNEVHTLPYTGISLGWMWWDPKTRPMPRPTPCQRTLVTDNHIHHVMQTLSDGGGIYCLGLQPDSVIRGNLIHDIAANVGRAESNGMFLDQGTGQFVIEENLIYAVDRSPLRFHKGWHNVVRRNLLVAAEGVPAVRYNDTVEQRIVLEENEVVDQVPEARLQEARQRAGLQLP